MNNVNKIMKYIAKGDTGRQMMNMLGMRQRRTGRNSLMVIGVGALLAAIFGRNRNNIVRVQSFLKPKNKVTDSDFSRFATAEFAEEFISEAMQTPAGQKQDWNQLLLEQNTKNNQNNK